MTELLERLPDLASHAESSSLVRSTRFLSVSTGKGGIGKTTTAVSLAAAIAAAGGRVAVCDLDYQRNATDLLPPIVDADQLRTVFDVVAARKPGVTRKALFPTQWSTLPQIADAGGAIDVMPGDSQFIDRHVDEHGVDALAVALDGLRGEYDVVILDCPPSTGSVVQAALYSADTVLMVTEAVHLSLKSLGRTAVFVGEFNAHSPSPVAVSGILVTKFNGRLKEQREGLAALKSRFHEDLLPIRIPHRAAVDSANGRHVPVLAWPGPEARMVASAYAATAKTVLSRLGDPAHAHLVENLDAFVDTGLVVL